MSQESSPAAAQQEGYSQEMHQSNWIYFSQSLYGVEE